jgi:IS1 family transposase
MLIPLRKINEIPKSLNSGAIDRSIDAFLKDSHVTDVPINAAGLKQQLTDTIASVVVFKNNPTVYYWVAEYEGEIVAWVLTHATKDVDNSMCYWMTDTWVAPQLRRNPIVKTWYQLLREDAKHLGCKHILIPSSRNTKAYLRFLGKGWHEYLTILKEDI